MALTVRNNSKPRKKCKTCQYRASDRARGCNYMFLTGKRRGCKAEECTVYVKGKKLVKTNDPMWGVKGEYEY